MATSKIQRLTSFFATGAACWFACICLAGNLFARPIPASNAAELDAALKIVQPGDVVILKNGRWHDVRVIVNRGGQPDNPIELRAETPGKVILDGFSLLFINAPFVTVDGLFFYKSTMENPPVRIGSQKSWALIYFNSNRGIVRNTAVVDCNPPSFDTKYYWACFNGDNNLIDHCYFNGKNHLEPVIGNNFGAKHNGVVSSYFKDIPYAEPNGREILRIWGYGRNGELGDDGAFFNVENNLFDHADGEGEEIVSLKSNRNAIRHNTVIATRGCLNIRQGSFNTIEDNVILCQDAPKAYGLRISGRDNVVRNNFISHADRGIVIMCGDYAEKNLSGQYEPMPAATGENAGTAKYAQVKNLTLTGNVVVGSKAYDLAIGDNYKAHWPVSQMILLPEDCLVASNRFIRPHGGNSVIGATAETTPPLDQFTFQPNQYAGNILVGGKDKFTPSATGFESAPLPADWDETQESARIKPLTPADVGPDWAGNENLYRAIDPVKVSQK